MYILNLIHDGLTPPLGLPPKCRETINNDMHVDDQANHLGSKRLDSWTGSKSAKSKSEHGCCRDLINKAATSQIPASKKNSRGTAFPRDESYGSTASGSRTEPSSNSTRELRGRCKWRVKRGPSGSLKNGPAQRSRDNDETQRWTQSKTANRWSDTQMCSWQMVS